jgi:putative protease
MERVKVGEVFKYYAKPEVAAIRLTDGSLKVGDEIQVQGATTDFTQVVDSMEIEHEKVESASVGQSVGIKVKERARPGDIVYKLVK